VEHRRARTRSAADDILLSDLIDFLDMEIPLLLLISGWLLVVVLVAGACMVAGIGDKQQFALEIDADRESLAPASALRTEHAAGERELAGLERQAA
jgi:hypothetical protein